MAALKPGLRAVLFDLDGTLLDSIPDLAEACHRMMVELGRPPHPTETIRTFVGKGMLNLVRRCLEAGGGADEAEFDAAVDAFRRHYAVVNGDCTEVYPGVVPALAALAAPLVAAVLGHDPFAPDLFARFEPPSATHPLGTDDLGRDILLRRGAVGRDVSVRRIR